MPHISHFYIGHKANGVFSFGLCPVLNVFHMRSFSELIQLMDSFHKVIGFPVSRRPMCLLVFVWVGGREVRWKGRRWGSVGGGDIKETGNRIPSFHQACGAQRQRKWNPPCDHERLGCLSHLAPFSFSLIQLYQATLCIRRQVKSSFILFYKYIQGFTLNRILLKYLDQKCTEFTMRE